MHGSTSFFKKDGISLKSLGATTPHACFHQKKCCFAKVCKFTQASLLGFEERQVYMSHLMITYACLYRRSAFLIFRQASLLGFEERQVSKATIDEIQVCQ